MAWNFEKAFDLKKRKAPAEDWKGSARRHGCTVGTLKHMLHGCSGETEAFLMNWLSA